jgi:hypothetical protein
MLYHVFLFFCHNRSHSPSRWPKVCYLKNAKVITLFWFLFWLTKERNKIHIPRRKKILAATGKSTIEEAISRQVSPKGKVAQRSRTNVGGEKSFNTAALQSQPGIRP